MYLLCVAQAFKGTRVTVSSATIGKRCGLSESNANIAVNRLCAKGVISKRRRGANGKNLPSLYIVPDYSNIQTGYFTLRRKDLADLAHCFSAFIIYAFYCKCQNMQTGEAVPSVSQTHSHTRLSKTTIRFWNRWLEEKGYLKIFRYIKQNGSFGHNRYYIFKLQFDASIAKFSQEVMDEEFVSTVHFVRFIGRSVIVQPSADDFYMWGRSNSAITI